jgi:hypothetical protein
VGGRLRFHELRFLHDLVTRLRDLPPRQRALQRCWDDWWDQNLRFSVMDQLSRPVLLAEHGCDPRTLGVNIFDNAHFTYVPHRRRG